jgi:hypothetical protein
MCKKRKEMETAGRRIILGIHTNIDLHVEFFLVQINSTYGHKYSASQIISVRARNKNNEELGNIQSNRHEQLLAVP